MTYYKLRWVHFDESDEYEDLKKCQLLMNSEWEADDYSDLIAQIEQHTKTKVKSISYTSSLDKLNSIYNHQRSVEKSIVPHAAGSELPTEDDEHFI